MKGSPFRSFVLFLVCLSAIGARPSFGAERSLLGWTAEPLTGSISADRPGLSTSPETVPRGRFQLEGGYQFTADRGTESHEMPLLLLRAGMTRNLELRVGWNGLTWTENNGRFKPEANDMSLGIKVSALEQQGLFPALGFLGSLSLPTGSGSQTSNRVDPTGGLLWSYDFTDGTGVFGTVLTSSLTGDDGRYFEAANSAGLSLRITSRLASFVEYFGFYRNHGSGPSHNLNGGFTYLVTDNVQLDINGGFGLNRRADDYFLGSGIAFRF